MSFVVLTQFVS